MEQNKKPKMKLWKKILIGIAVLFVLTKLFGSSDKKDESKPTESTSIESKEKLEEENKKLKEENKKLKEDYEAAMTTLKMYVDKETDNENKEEPKNEENKTENKGEVSREYKNALKMAENYIQTIPFSKQGLYEQLTSEHGSKFPEDAAQYAIDNLKVDYKEQALKSAKNYMKTIPMSDDELYEQLTSDHGEKFTPEEAQYAIDNLDN